jgi:hypothetical protein
VGGQVDLAKRPFAYEVAEGIVADGVKLLGRKLPAKISE